MECIQRAPGACIHRQGRGKSRLRGIPATMDGMSLAEVYKTIKAVCELPQSGSGEIMAYVAYAVIGMLLTHSLGWCVDDDVDESSDPPNEMYN